MQTKRINYYKIQKIEKYLIIEEDYERQKFDVWISGDETKKDTLIFTIEMSYKVEEKVDEYMNEYFTVLHIAKEIYHMFL